MYQFQCKLKCLKHLIKKWDHNTFGNIFQAQQDLNKEMRTLQQQIISDGYTDELMARELQLKTQLDDRSKQEEILWWQKSRVSWLKEGERNTKFFHRTTIQRRMHNSIIAIKTQEGEKVEEQAEIERAFLAQFQTVHKEPPVDRSTAINKIIQYIQKIITDEHN